MSVTSRISAAVAYLPVLGWLYVLLLQRKDELAMFHLRQSIGLFVFLILVLAGWFVVTWLSAWIPFAFMFGTASFALVMAAYAMGAVSWIVGIVYALLGRPVFMPIVGRRAAAIRL
jgi:uncharacterized membrane protein